MTHSVLKPKRKISFVFVFMTFLMFEILAIFVALGFIYYSLKSTSFSLEKILKSRGREFTLAIKNNVENYLNHNEQNKISTFFYNFPKKNGNYKYKRISKLILLSKQGYLLAHSNILHMANSYIHPDYNKAIFHKALDLKNGVVRVIPWEIRKGNTYHSPLLMPLMTYIYPNLDKPALKFSTSIYKRNKNGNNMLYASLHIVLPRLELRRYMNEFSYEAGYYLLAASIIALFFTAILILLYIASLKPRLKPIVQYDGNKEIEKSLEMKEKEYSVLPDRLKEEKIDSMEKLLPDTEGNEEKVKTAIYVGE